MYPVLVAAAARAAGVSLKLVAFDEETRPDLVDSFAPADRRTLLWIPTKPPSPSSALTQIPSGLAYAHVYIS